MEKSVDTAALPIFSAIRETFDIRKGDIRTYSPLTLAYIGDGIYDLVNRSMIVAQGNTKASQLHNHTSHLLPVLSEEEEAVYKRGRNAKSPTMAKNASMSDYRRATGFEALMGYLYLADRFDRILELTVLGLDGLGKEEKTHRS